MKKVCSWLFSPLIVLAGISPVWAQMSVKAAEEVVSVAKAGRVAVEAAHVTPIAVEAIDAMRQALATTGTKAATLAQASSKKSWASLVQTANFALKESTTTPLQTARQVLEESVTGKIKITSEHTLLVNYPIIAVEGKTVLGQVQVQEALNTYSYIINQKFGDGSLEEWGKIMSAVTNIGLFSTAESADLVLSAATNRGNLGILTGPTDVAVVRSLLNLGAPEKVKKLLAVRLQGVDSNANPLKLPYEWGEIQKYMQEAGFELNIPQNRIAPVPEKSTMARMPTAEAWMLYYNPYNAFMADPSAETTRNFLKLREGMKQKLTTLQVTQAINNSLSGNN